MARRGRRALSRRTRVAFAAAALGEAMAAAVAIGRPRRAAALAGRPYSPAHHGLIQDFGFYNLGFAALFTWAALQPHAVEPFTIVALCVYLAQQESA
jgi:hypothetical protein